MYILSSQAIIVYTPVHYRMFTDKKSRRTRPMNLCRTEEIQTLATVALTRTSNLMTGSRFQRMKVMLCIVTMNCHESSDQFCNIPFVLYVVLRVQ